MGYLSKQKKEWRPEDHLDEIIQKKAQYQNSDTIESENRFVNLLVCENAGNLYCYSDSKEAACSTLAGKSLSSVSVFILDEQDNHVIASCTSNEKGDVTHYAGKGDRFYCAAIAPDYELYVSPTILVTGNTENDYSGLVGLYLKKESDTLSIPYYIRVYIKDLAEPDSDYSALSNGFVAFRCIEKDCADHEDFDSMFYSVWTNESGFLSVTGVLSECIPQNLPCIFSQLLCIMYITKVSLLKKRRSCYDRRDH